MVVVLGVDAHKRTHTVVAVDANGRKLGEKTIATTSAGHDDAVRWARGRYGRELLWGVEDCRPLTARLEGDLLAAGLRVVRVPPHLMSRARASSRTPGKSDPIDALAVARAVLREPDLPVASHDPVSLELSLLVGRREDLVGQRTATINRLLSRVHQLDPSRGPVGNWQRHKTRSPPHGGIAGDLRGCKPQGCTADARPRQCRDDPGRLRRVVRIRYGRRGRESGQDVGTPGGLARMFAIKNTTTSQLADNNVVPSVRFELTLHGF